MDGQIPFEHRMRWKIFYGDTDAGGIVYYANYLRYVEAGRYEYCAALGIDLAAWHERDAIFAVVNVEARYRSPARLGDEIEIRTVTRDLTAGTVTFESKVYRVSDGGLLFEANIRAACLNEKGRPRRIPVEIVDILKRHRGTDGPPLVA